MASKKAVPRKATGPRPDRYSKKKKGYVSQSFRISVDEANLIREAAENKGFSINLWMTQHLVPIAKKEIAAKKLTDQLERE